MNDLLKRNLGVKIFAVLGAVILWFFVMNEENPYLEKKISVPIEIEDAQKDCKLTLSKEKASLKLRGKRSSFLAAPKSSFYVWVDASGLGEGAHKVDVESKLPPGLELVSLNPGEVTLSVERILKKTVPLSVVTTDSVAEGSVVARILPESSVVIVTGTRSAVEKVKKVIASVPLSDSRSSFTAEVPLTAVDEKNSPVEGVETAKSNMIIKVEITKGLSKKTVSIKPVFSSDLPSGYAFSGAKVTPETVTIEGSQEMLAKINEMPTAPISLNGMTKPFKRIVKLRYPSGVSATVSDVAVDIEITEKK